MLLTRRDIAGDDPFLHLRNENFIRYDRNYWGGRVIDIWLRRKTLRLREIYELNALDTIALLINLGLGVSVVPDWMPPWPDGVHLRKFALPDAPAREIGIIWSRTSISLPLIQTFVAQAQKMAKPG